LKADFLSVGLDLREVADSGRGCRRMMHLVYELDRLGTDCTFELCSERTPPIDRHVWSDRCRVVHPRYRLRLMHRPILGHLRTAIWGPAQVMHFLTADCWYAPTSRTAVTLHDLAPLQFPEFFFGNQEMENRYIGHLQRIFEIAECVITVSECSKQRILEAFPQSEPKLRIVYPGVSPEFFPEVWGVNDRRWFREKIGVPEGYLLYCGGIDGCKNLQFLLESFKIFRDRTGSPRRLVIVGDVGTPRRGMVPLPVTVHKLGLEDFVTFTGRISDEFLRRHYCSASLFVFPSKIEGFGYAPLEAMACGCPVLCSNAPALPETVGEAAHLLPPDDPEAWAEAMDRLLDDIELRRSLVRKGRERADRFKWSETAEGVLRVYREVAGCKSTQGGAS